MYRPRPLNREMIDIKIVPASEGWSVLEFWMDHEERDITDIECESTPIIAWRIVTMSEYLTDPECVSAVESTVTPITPLGDVCLSNYIMRPDKKVEIIGDSTFDTYESAKEQFYARWLGRKAKQKLKEVIDEK